jgi:folate-binding protein YgfZ
VHLLLPQDQLADAHAHLKKYSIFSKVTLTAADTIPLLGIRGSNAADTLGTLLSATTPATGLSCTSNDTVTAALAPDRFLLILSDAHAPAILEQLVAEQAVITTENDWQLVNIRAGLASVHTQTRDQFQPQELNYPALAGVSYNKGCYTGQEVVARLYFRGKLKQRLYRLTAEGQPSDVRSIHAGEQHVGDVVNMARSGDSSIELLAVVKNTAISTGELTLDVHGPSLRVQPLPYPLDSDKEE